LSRGDKSEGGKFQKKGREIGEKKKKKLTIHAATLRFLNKIVI